MPRTFPLSQDGRQSGGSQCAAMSPEQRAALHTGECSRERGLLGRRSEDWNTVG